MAMHLRQICLAAETLGPVVEDLKAVLGIEVCYVDPGVKQFGLENTLLPVGSQFLEVVAPIEVDTAVGRYLERRAGNGGYMVICQCDNLEEQVSCRGRARSLGVRIAFEHAHRSGNIMQLHPADTGGSFFEIDWDKHKDPQTHWEPAGGLAWLPYVSIDIASAITAAELQADNPAALAKRWSYIAGLPAERTGIDKWQIKLANATLRFVPAQDGRGDGLGGIDLRVKDATALFEAARARDIPLYQDHFILGGLRFCIA